MVLVLPVEDTFVVLAVTITVSDVSLVVSFTGDSVIDAEVPPATIVEVVDDKL